MEVVYILIAAFTLLLLSMFIWACGKINDVEKKVDIVLAELRKWRERE